MHIKDKAERFRSLHRAGSPLVLVNVWDPGSTAAVAKTGAQAIATASWAMAASQGYSDGEKIPRDLLIDVLRRIVGSTDLPVTVDLESGFGADPEGVAQTVRLALEAGAIGCNIEDSSPSDGSLRSPEEAASRIRAARQAVNSACPGFFINARCDTFMMKSADSDESALVDETIARVRVYAEAGADGLFVPGVTDLRPIEHLAGLSPLPLNVMRLGPEPSIAALAAAGVARISHGPAPYRAAMEALEQAVGNVFSR